MKLRLLNKQFPIQDPMWTSWGPWGECSMTCGLGHKRKYRKCEDHMTGEEAKLGLDCLGGSTELVEDCKPIDCPGNSSFNGPLCPLCPLINFSPRRIDRVVELEWLQRSLWTLRHQDQEEVLREAVAAVRRQGLRGGEGGTWQMCQPKGGCFEMSRRCECVNFKSSCQSLANVSTQGRVF